VSAAAAVAAPVRTTFAVALDLPAGTDPEEARAYIERAVATGWADLPPRHPLCLLDQRSVRAEIHDAGAPLRNPALMFWIARYLCGSPSPCDKHRAMSTEILRRARETVEDAR
jgi:hypothetical protein